MLHNAQPSQREFRRRAFLGGLGVLSAASLTGCGSILYPERVGQPRGPLNWKVVALDTLGLLFFFVPGVIAFAVDFYNGTIYLPPDNVPSGEPLILSRRVPLPAGQRNLAGVQEVVSREAGLSLKLEPGQYLTQQLTSLSDAPTAATELEQQWQELRAQSPE